MPMTANGLAKLLEECGELSQVAAKKLAYFDTDEHPDGAGLLTLRMQDEAADVVAAITFVAMQFNFDQEEFHARIARKLALFERWHADGGNGANCFHSTQQAEKGGEA